MSSTTRRALLGLSAASLALSIIAGRTRAAPRLAPGESDVFVVVDVQNCFVPGGSLAKAWADMNSAGVQRVQSSDLL